MESTANYSLRKPAATDYYNIEDFNTNADLIDAALKNLEDRKADLDEGDKIPITQLPDDSPTSAAVAAALGLAGDPAMVSAALLALLELLNGKAPDSHEHSAADITSGALALTRGGSGQTTAAKALYAFITGATALAATGLATGDYIGIGDVSAATGKKATVANLAAFLNANLAMAKITVGSYVGTGTYGSGNPNTLTFDFEPKIVVIWPSTQLYSGAIYGGQVWLSPMSEGIGSVSSGLEYYLCNLAWSENTLSFYCTNAEKQLNSSGNTYYYAAIG